MKKHLFFSALFAIQLCSCSFMFGGNDDPNVSSSESSLSSNKSSVSSGGTSSSSSVVSNDYGIKEASIGVEYKLNDFVDDWKFERGFDETKYTDWSIYVSERTTQANPAYDVEQDEGLKFSIYWKYRYYYGKYFNGPYVKFDESGTCPNGQVRITNSSTKKYVTLQVNDTKLYKTQFLSDDGMADIYQKECLRGTSIRFDEFGYQGGESFAGWSDGTEVFSESTEFKVTKDSSYYPVFSQEGTKGLVFEESETYPGCYSVTGYTGHDIDIVIPDKRNGKAVATIGNNAFKNISTISSVKLPYSIKKICLSAFNGCSSLREVDIPLGSLMTEIGESAFSGCTSLSDIFIQKGVKTINPSAFANCPYLNVLYAADSQDDIYIGSSAFHSTATSFYGIRKAFDKDGFRYAIKKDKTVIAMKYLSSSDSSEFYLDKVKYGNDELTISEIGNGCFGDNTYVTKVTVSDDISAVGANAFKGCTSLISFKFSETNSIKSLGDYAFNGCSSLNLPDFEKLNNVESIGDYCFCDCDFYNSNKLVFSVGSLLKEVGDSAFANTALRGVLFPANSLTIGTNVFKGCTAVTICFRGKESDIAFDNGWNPLERPVYYGIKEMVFQSTSAGFKYILNSAGNAIITGIFKSPQHEEDGKTLTIESVDGHDVIGIGKYALMSRTVEEEKIVLGSKITFIGQQAFSKSWLTSLTFKGKSNISSIQKMAFYQCQYLQNVTFEEDSSLATIDEHAFDGCVKLSYIGLRGYKDDGSCPKLKTIGKQAFYQCSSLEPVMIPESVTNIGENCFYGAKSSECTLMFQHISTSNIELGNNALGSLPKYENIKEAKIIDGNIVASDYQSKLTLIKGGSNSNVDTSEIQSSYGSGYQMKTIGSYAFSGNTNLVSLGISSSIETIDTYAFNEASNLKTVEYVMNSAGTKTNSSLSVIDQKAFYYCKKLSYIVLPLSVKRVGVDAFTNTSSNAYPIYCEATDGTNIIYGAASSTSKLANNYTKRTVYSSDWSYVDGSPTINS